MTDVGLTAVVLALSVTFPDGDEHGADIRGVLQEMPLLSNTTEYVDVGVYLAWESAVYASHRFALKWLNESSGTIQDQYGWLSGENERMNRADHRLRLHCPNSGWYTLEIQLGDAVSRQSVRVKRLSTSQGSAQPPS